MSCLATINVAGFGCPQLYTWLHKGSITDEDFTSIILGSILPSYDTYITVILATSSSLNQSLSHTNLIDVLCDEVDLKAIMNKKLKKDIKFWNCLEKRHTRAECWGAGGKGPKMWKGKQKETAVKVEIRSDVEDVDAVWMVNTDENMRA